MHLITCWPLYRPLESSIIVPGVPLLQKDFHETSHLITSLVVSIFVLGFAFGPILLSPLSELYGRRLVLNVCNVATLAFSMASASAPNIASFIVFRFIAGSFGAGPMNIGGGSIADQVSFDRRGTVMSIFFTGIFLGPVLGYVPYHKPGWWINNKCSGLWLAVLLHMLLAGAGYFGSWQLWYGDIVVRRVSLGR